MKKNILTIILALIVLLPSRADDTAFFDSEVADKWVELNPHVSIGMSSIMQNYGSSVPGLSEFLLSPGCSMHTGMDVRFNIHNSLGLGTGLDFGINNSRYAMSLVTPSTNAISSIYVKNHYYDLTVPVYFSARFNIGRKVMWNTDLGVYFCEGIGGTLKATGYASGENSLGQPVVTEAKFSTSYYSSNQPLVNGVRRFDWGPRIATGLVFNHNVTFNCILQIGARNLSQGAGAVNTKYRNLSLAFQIGWIL